MLDKPPVESERRSWTWVVLFTLVIFCTIPAARTLREAVDARIGREIFLYAGFLLLLVLAVQALVLLRRRGVGVGAYVGLAAVLGIFGALIYALREIPEEALHVAEYGLLGLLVYRALVHRIRDGSVYVAAGLIVGMIGLIDEYLQWIAPSRYFDLRDVGINFAAGALSQLAIALGLRPRLVSGRPRPANLGRLCYLGAAALLLVSLGFVNTPPRITWYATHVPGLGFILDSNSTMAEYGYRHRSDSGAVFRSRFSAAELRRLDRERGAEVGPIADRYLRGGGYREFLDRYSVLRDPWAHEFGVRLFRREAHLDRARDNTDVRERHYRIAYHENRILQQYFPRALEQSTRSWSEDVSRDVEAYFVPGEDYMSPVSANIITRIGEWQLQGLFLSTMVVLCFSGKRLGRDARSQETEREA